MKFIFYDHIPRRAAITKDHRLEGSSRGYRAKMKSSARHVFSVACRLLPSYYDLTWASMSDVS